MRGKLQAIAIASLLALVSLVMPPVSIISSATVALVTLRLGAIEGAIVLGCSALLVAISGFFLMGSYQYVLFYGAILWIPIWLISVILREGRHLPLAIEVAVVIGIFGVVGFYLYDPNIAVMWKSILIQMMPPHVQIGDIEHTLDILSHYMTGIIAAAMVFGLMFGLFLGRWWQALLFNPGGFKKEFLSLTTHPRLAIISILVLLVALLSSGMISEVSWNVVILLLVLYTFIGTAVVHTAFAAMKLSRYTVPMFYITMFLIPHAVLPVALVGLIDPWMNLREKFSDRYTPKGD